MGLQQQSAAYRAGWVLIDARATFHRAGGAVVGWKPHPLFLIKSQSRLVPSSTFQKSFQLENQRQIQPRCSSLSSDESKSLILSPQPEFDFRYTEVVF